MNGATQQVMQVRLDWSAAETAQPLHANQIITQVGPQGSDGVPDGVYISFGSAPPPLLPDDPAEREEVIRRLRDTGVKVNVLGQVHITRRLLEDLIGVLQTTVEKYDIAAGIAQVEP